MRSFVFLLLLAFLGSCCEEEVDDRYESLVTKTGGVIQVRKDSTLVLDPSLLVVENTRRVAPPNSTDTLYSGCVDQEEKEWVRVKFTSSVGDIEADKVYYGHWVTYKTTTKEEDYSRFVPYYTDKRRCGFHPRYPIADKRLGFWAERDAYNEVKCTTNLLYLGYDAALHPIKQYFPCHPNQLVWYVIKEKIDWGLDL